MPDTLISDEDQACLSTHLQTFAQAYTCPSCEEAGTFDVSSVESIICQRVARCRVRCSNRKCGRWAVVTMTMRMDKYRPDIDGEVEGGC